MWPSREQDDGNIEPNPEVEILMQMGQSSPNLQLHWQHVSQLKPTDGLSVLEPDVVSIGISSMPDN
jgi:hypothetical protein